MGTRRGRVEEDLARQIELVDGAEEAERLCSGEHTERVGQDLDELGGEGVGLLLPLPGAGHTSRVCQREGEHGSVVERAARFERPFTLGHGNLDLASIEAELRRQQRQD